MCVAQLWRKPCGLVEWFDVFTRLQIHWRVRGIPRSERNRRARSWRAALFVPRRADPRQVRPAFAQIMFEYLDGRAAQRNDSFLVPFAPDLNSSRIERKVAHRQRGEFGDAQSARIQQFENRAIAECRGFRLRMRCRHGCALKHLCHFGLGKRLGQHLPRLRRLDVDRRVVMNAAVEQQPFIKSAQAAQLSRGRARIDAMVAQMLKQRGHIALRGAEQHRVAAFEELRKDAQIAEVGFDCERAKSFFYKEI